jgi:predicted RNase H-like HicB family nuclease
MTTRLQHRFVQPATPLSGYSYTVDQITIMVDTCGETGALVASWDDPSGAGGLTTQAETLSELEINIREAISAYFEPNNTPKQIRLHFVDDPVLAAA